MTKNGAGNQKSPTPFGFKQLSLFSFAYPEHLSLTSGTYALGGRFAIFHSDGFGILHFLLGFTLNTICFHLIYPPF
jgi:hypothetical protein